MGRYWDHLRARPWQTAGLGSLAYNLLFPLTDLALLALPVLLIGYLHPIYVARFDRRRSSSSALRAQGTGHRAQDTA